MTLSSGCGGVSFLMKKYTEKANQLALILIIYALSIIIYIFQSPLVKNCRQQRQISTTLILT